MSPSSLVAAITSPQPGFKLRAGQKASVTVRAEAPAAARAEGAGAGELSWVLSLRGPGDTSTALASGTGSLHDVAVAEIDAANLLAGEPYGLVLTVGDAAASATAETPFIVPDPQYTLIPLTEGNFAWEDGTGNYEYGGYDHTWDMDGSGNRILYSKGYGDPTPFDLLDRQTGQRQRLSVPLAGSGALALSGDGARLVFRGFFANQHGDGLGYLDLATQTSRFIANRVAGGSYRSFSVDEHGRRVVYLGHFLYDDATQEIRQLTDDPNLVGGGVHTDFRANPTDQ